MVVRKSLIWLIASFALTPLVWGLLGSLFGMPWHLDGDVLLLRFLIGIVYLPMFAVFVVLALSPFYAVGLLLWPYVVRLRPSLDLDRRGLALACGFLSTPGALVVGSSYANSAGIFDIREFWTTFLIALLTGWLGLLLPRLFLDCLAPGVFLRESSPPAV